MNDYVGLLRALTEAGVDFVVVGGTAAVLHGASTVTYDLDVVMAFTHDNCERLLRAVGPLHPRLSHTADKRPLTLTADELATFRNLYLATDLGRFDVLGSLPPIPSTEAVIASAEKIDVAGMTVKLVSLDHLIEVKASMNRPKDKQSEVELRAIAAARRQR